MNNEIQLISDGDGLAVIGDSAAVERFLAHENLPSKDLGMPKLGKAMNAGVAGLQTGSNLAEQSGRWVQLTAESAEKVKRFGLMEGKTPGVRHAMVGQPGEIKSWLQISKAPGAVASNPAALAGAAGIMAQMAMQQAMDEITDYLERIDEKLNDVLRAQKDAVVAQMIGVGLQIEEAMTLQAHVGRVNEVTWSKVQDSAGTIAHTQAYALLQLDAIAEKLESETKVSELAETANLVQAKVHEWLVILARCFQLQDGIAVLELDRVLHTSPDDLDGHRVGLKAARQERLETISRSTERLLNRMSSAAGVANSKVLFNPAKSPAVVQASAHVAGVIGDFHDLLGVGVDDHAVEQRRWKEAASEVKDRARQAGAEGVNAARKRGHEALDRAKLMKGRVSSGFAERSFGRRGAEVDDADGTSS